MLNPILFNQKAGPKVLPFFISLHILVFAGMISLLFPACRPCVQAPCSEYESLKINFVHFADTTAYHLKVKFYEADGSFQHCLDSTRLDAAEFFVTSDTVNYSISSMYYPAPNTPVERDLEIINLYDQHVIRITQLMHHHYTGKVCDYPAGTAPLSTCINSISSFSYSISGGSITSDGRQLFVQP